MEIKWFGHAFFLIINSRGIRIAMDPFDDTLGYRVPHIKAEIVTVSHNHFDHDNPRLVKGLHPVLKGPVDRDIHKIHFRGIPTFHDSKRGKLRGENTIFIVETDGLKLVHLGDLGHILPSDLINTIGDVDVVFVPVGGVYTIGPEEAKRVVEALKPRVAIPMHYFTPYIKLPLRPVDDFASLFEDVRYLDGDGLEVEASNLPEKGEIWVFKL